MSFPDDILKIILESFNFIQLAKSRQVNKQWKRIIDSIHNSTKIEITCLNFVITIRTKYVKLVVDTHLDFVTDLDCDEEGDYVDFPESNEAITKFNSLIDCINLKRSECLIEYYNTDLFNQDEGTCKLQVKNGLLIFTVNDSEIGAIKIRKNEIKILKSLVLIVRSIKRKIMISS